MHTLAPAALIGVRTLTATPLLFLVASRRGIFTVKWPDLAKLAGLAFLGVTANQLLFAEGLRRAGAVHAVVLVVLIPVLTLLIAVVTGGEKANVWRVAGVSVALIGAGGVIEIERFDVSSETFIGDLLLLSNALCYAIYLVKVRPVIARVNALVVIAWVFLFGALLALPWTIPAMRNTDWQAVSPRTWATVGFIILGPTCGAYALNAYALKRVDASVVAVFVALQPFVGAIAAWLLLGDTVSVRTAISGGILIAGVFVASRGEKQV